MFIVARTAQDYLDLQIGQNNGTLYCLYPLLWDIGLLFWALLEVQVLGPSCWGPLATSTCALAAVSNLKTVVPATSATVASCRTPTQPTAQGAQHGLIKA